MTAVLADIVGRMALVLHLTRRVRVTVDIKVSETELGLLTEQDWKRPLIKYLS